MCGIIGYIGKKQQAKEVLLHGLHTLEYRGYDSAGMALWMQDKIQLMKAKGKVSVLADKVKDDAINSHIGIAHTRWATHGIPSEHNSHPHQNQHVTLVHNGIIENYHILKEHLLQQGYTFQSETDSEIAAAYIDYCYKQTNSKVEALAKAYHELKGSFAFGILFDDDSSTIYAMRKQSPLVLGTSTDAQFLASDISAFLAYTNHYVILQHEEIAIIKEDQIEIVDLQQNILSKDILVSELDVQAIQKDGYDHFMLKEIHEEPEAVEKTIHSYMQESIEELKESFSYLKDIDHIHIVACGSAMYAGMIAKSLIESQARIQTDCVCASEYRYQHPIYTKHTLAIFISQSGETADTLAALQMAKEQGCLTLGIVNVVGSSLAREADHVLYTKAGPEISVATTKAYCTQVALLSLVACYFAMNKNLLDVDSITNINKDLKNISTTMESLIYQTSYRNLAKHIYEKEHIFFLGRGLDYALCMEGSLKLKEISYIHSEAYPAGELKHGTISLIEEGTPVIALATDMDLYEKTLSNIKEVKARGAYVILLISENLKEHVTKDACDDVIYVPETTKFLQGVLTIIPLQLLAYETACLRGCEIDQPRNLAKSVTVE